MSRAGSGEATHFAADVHKCIFVNDVRPKKQEKTKGREKRRERRICGEKERGTERSGGANERTPQGGGSAGMRF